MPTVSVIIPIYNPDEVWLEKSVTSVREQTFDDIECIIINDSPEYCFPSHLSPTNDVEIIEHEENKGIAAARNTGIKQSSGRFINFLDQDDFWHEEKIEKQISAFDCCPDETGVIYTDVAWVGEKTGLVPTGPTPTDRTKRIQEIYQNNPPVTISALIKRECFESHGLLDESFFGCDDLDFWLRIADSFGFQYLPETLAYKRAHAGNTSNSSQAMLEDRRKILNKYSEVYRIKEEIYVKELTKAYFHSSRASLSDRQYLTAGGYIASGLHDTISHIPTLVYKNTFGKGAERSP